MKLITILIFISSLLFSSFIDDEIKRFGLKKSEVSILIKEAGEEGETIYSLNENKARVPASVMKLFTTYASLLELGFNHKIKTPFYLTTNNDIYIKGYGDPSLEFDDLNEVVNALKKRNIKSVRNIIIDRTFFNNPSKNSAHFDNNTYSAYNAMPDALMFNKRVSKITLNPKTNYTHSWYADKSYKVINQINYTNHSCRGKYSWLSSSIKEGNNPSITLKGNFSKRCSKRVFSKVLTNPHKTLYYSLKYKLNKSGIKVLGTLKNSSYIPNKRLFYTHYSPTLKTLISHTAKKSDNLYARQLFLYLGAKIYKTPSTLKKSKEAIKRVLYKNGALKKYNNTIFDNGSGLSRKARTTAKTLVTLCDDGFDRFNKKWMKTLSIAGVDGTIRRRFKGSIAQNRAWMKTGTLNRAKNIAGYVKNRSGKYYTLAILVNSKKARYSGAGLQNRIIKWLANSTAKPTKKTKSYAIQISSTKEYPTKETFKEFTPTKIVKHNEHYKILIGDFNNLKIANQKLKEIRKKVKDAFIIELRS